MDFLSIISYSFAGISLVLLILMIFKKQKLLSKNLIMQNKIMTLESDLLLRNQQINDIAIQDNKKNQQVKNIETHSNSTNSSELLNLRKDISKLKDENKKLKDEIRQKDKMLKEEMQLSNNKLYSLNEENSRLIKQMREMDLLLKESNNNLKNQVPLVDFEKKVLEINSLKDELLKIKQKNSEQEKINKQNISKLNVSYEKLKNAEQELQKWTETSKTSDGKPIDPRAFLRWHDRALLGRKMYKLMRQMRELSDSKVTTYQDGVIAISEWILKQKNINLPQVSSGEVKADRLLAEAWSAVSANQQNSMTTHTDSSLI